MSLVNSLTYSNQGRDKLIASRNTFTFIANISVLTLALLLFSIDAFDGVAKFRILAIIVVSFGLVTSIWYIVVMKEPYLVSEAKRL